ncbi:TPM domain-containing protein, partial [Leptospira bandrabouensis]|uniref:TPM domain-containing protein n=1 Tax=Leptospira bandrabouensis TaxID=2484903 RepID=UPI001EE8448E
MKRIFLTLTLVSIFSCKVPFGSYPVLTGPVVDPSGYLPLEIKSKLETILLEEEKITSNQVVVYIAESLNESTIEKEAVAVFEQWKLGQKEKDNGILLLLAPNDKKVRIEVGYGLESILTDLIAKRIIDEIIIPDMKA